MKYTKLILLLCSLIYISAFVGCGNESSKTDVSDNPNSTSQEQNVISSENSSEGFDWETVKQDITLDRKKIDVPFSVNDLGEGYKMSYIYDSAWGDKSCEGRVVTIDSDGSESTSCYLAFYDLTVDEYNDDIKCSSISGAKTLIVQGIGKGSSLEDAEKILGKPYKTDKVFAFYLSKSGTERIELKYDTETDKVEEVQITLDFKDEWL